MRKQQKVHINKVITDPLLLISVCDDIKGKIIESLLDEADVPFYIKDGGAGGYIKVLMGKSMYGTDIYVDRRDFDDAKELIDGYFTDPEIGTAGNGTNDETGEETDEETGNENVNKIDCLYEPTSDRYQNRNKIIISILRIIFGIFLLSFVAGVIFLLIQMSGD